MSRKLNEFCSYRNETISSNNIDLANYVGVDNMVPNSGGIRKSDYLPEKGNVQKFCKGDILIGNIRPYFKKIWLAEFDGGASPDVLVIKPNKGIDPNVLFSILSSDHFFNYDMAGSKGSKMPRGDKKHIMNYPIFIDIESSVSANLIVKINQLISINSEINRNIESFYKQLFLAWFIQFDFPDKNGNPYKNSGGKMVFNETLQREIPAGWEALKLGDIIKETDSKQFDYSKRENTIDLSVMESDSICLSTLNTSDNFTTNLFEMKKGEILFGGIRPYLKKATVAPCDGAVAGTVLSFVPKRSGDFNFALLTMCSDFFFDYAVKNSKGTKMPVVSADDLLEYPIAYSKEVAELFNKESFCDVIAENVMQNNMLIKLRDYLSPLFVSGQIKG